MESRKEGGFGSNRRVASCGEKSNAVRTNRLSPPEIEGNGRDSAKVITW